MKKTRVKPENPLEWPAVNRLFKVFADGEVPNFVEVLAAINEISERNTDPPAPSDCLFPDDSRCKTCNL